MEENHAKMEKRVIDFIVSHLSRKREKITLRADLREDLGVDGDDGIEFIEAFSEEFNVDISSVEINKYFGPERGVGPLFLFYPIMLFLNWLFGWKLKEPSSNNLVSIHVSDLVESALSRAWIVKSESSQ
jgi:acyl carrier protein